MILFRPVGLGELELIAQADFRAFPPRLPGQPLFYPVLSREYADEIARDWNTKDPASGFAGFVTSFELRDDYAQQFERHTVGSRGRHEELWVPADRLTELNRHIVGRISILGTFYGEGFGQVPVIGQEGATGQVVWQGRHLNVVVRGGWEYAERPHVTGIVGIVAVTGEGRLVLTEQHRPPVDRRVIELPAGLVGDVAGQENESLEMAARRELLEETGYEAARMERLCHGTASAGISSEVVTLFRAAGLTKIGRGGGDATEAIVVHEVPVATVLPWLREREAAGILVDLRVYAALLFCRNQAARDEEHGDAGR